MIERIVLLRMTEGFSSKKSLGAIAEYSHDVLVGLPGVRDCHVGLAADDGTAANWHISLALRFESIDDLPAYVQHPDHRNYVDQYLRPKLASIVAYNFNL